MLPCVSKSTGKKKEYQFSKDDLWRNLIPISNAYESCRLILVIIFERRTISKSV